MDEHGCVHIMAGARNRASSVGVTSDLVRRVHRHRTDEMDGFTRGYGCKYLIWFGMHDRIVDAIDREKRIREWRRSWKLDLIETGNPGWEDLFPALI